MLLPIYVSKSAVGFVGRTPLMQDMTFKGATLDELVDEVRAFAPMLKPDPGVSSDPLAIMAGGIEYQGGEWLVVPIGDTSAEAVADSRSRRNISISARLESRIEHASKAAGTNFSQWISQAAAEKLSRGG
jgi:hypothetical protein